MGVIDSKAILILYIVLTLVFVWLYNYIMCIGCLNVDMVSYFMVL